MNNSIYKNPAYSIEERVDDLLSHMTLDEKLAQITGVWNDSEKFLDEEKNFSGEGASEHFPHGIGQAGRIFQGLGAKQMAEKYNEIQKHFIENTRLGIPVMFHEECLHGLMEYNAVSYPHPIAMAGSFNPQLVEQMYTLTAKDARARGARQALTPVLDVTRDPRWGRAEETFGEDPYLVSQMGLAAVKGFQGDSKDKLEDNRLIATLKHFAAHGQPENGTNCAPANFSERILREVFLQPFKVAVEKGNALSVMASYNEIDGVPSHASKWLLQDVLRKEYGFKGYVVSDYYGIEQLEERHKVAATEPDAAKLAIEAGVDIELPEPKIYPHLKELINEGKVDIAYIDTAVKNLLYYKFFSGLFENPYVDPIEAEKISVDPAARDLSYKLASECITLLKNKDNILPFQKDAFKTVAVIGPNADYHSIGGYSCPNENFVTILQGMQERLPNDIDVLYAEGCGVTTEEGSWFVDPVYRTDEEDDKALIEEAVKTAKQSDVIVLCIGGNEQTCREGWKEDHLGDRANLQMVGLQEELFNRLRELGKPIVVVLNHGRPLAITDVDEKADAILDCWNLGQETGYVVADAILGTINPSGKLAISVPRSVGHIPSFYNYKPTARRGYLFDDITPLYDFGYGLSYTNFELNDISLNKEEIKAGEDFSINLNIKNTGTVEGAEVIQVYIRDVASSVTRPVKELKAFKKLSLLPDEAKNITIHIDADSLAFYDINMEYTIEPGEFEIMVGTSSNDKDLTTVKLMVE